MDASGKERCEYFDGWSRGKGGYTEELGKISNPAQCCLWGPARVLTHGFCPGDTSQSHLDGARHASSAPLAKFFATHSFIGLFHSQSVYQRFRNRFCNAIVNSTTVSHLFTCQTASGGGVVVVVFQLPHPHPPTLHLFLFGIRSQGEEIGTTAAGHSAGMSYPAVSTYCTFSARARAGAGNSHPRA